MQKWSQVACGGLHCAALSFGNSVYVWGKGREGQLGLGNGVHFREEPTLVTLPTSLALPVVVNKVICGPLQTAAITGYSSIHYSSLTIICFIIIIIHHSSFIIHHSSFIIHHSSFIIHHSSFITHHSSLIIHHSSFIIHHSSLIIHHSSFITHHSSFIIHHYLLDYQTLYHERNGAGEERLIWRGDDQQIAGRCICGGYWSGDQ